MPYLQTVSICASLIFGIAALIFSLKGDKRTDTKDLEERVTRDTIVNTKLDVIGENVKSIKDDVSTMRQDIQNIDKRLVIVEQSTKSAHHRIDNLEEREDKHE